MKTSKILVVGSLVMDMITSTEVFPAPGETVLGEDFRTAAGGKGANQALQARLLGADVTMVGKVGTDGFGRRLTESLQSAGVHTGYISASPERPSAMGNIVVSLRDGKVQNNRIIVVPGANMALTKADAAFLESSIDAYDMVLLQFEIPMEVNEYVAEIAHKKGIPVVLNPAPAREVPASLLRSIQCICPNEHEAAILTGCDLSRDSDGLISDAKLRSATDRILAMGVPEVVITLGHQGAVYARKDTWSFCPAVQGTVVKDPTAAGDSFIGAYSYGVCSGLSPQQALKFASCTASITVSRMGAQPSLPALPEVLALSKERDLGIHDLFAEEPAN